VIDIALVGPLVESPIQAGGGLSGMLMAGALVIVLGLVAVAVWQGHVSTLLNRMLDGGGSSGTTAVESGDETAGQPGEESASDDPVGAATELTDKEVIVDILEDNDGRMKQARIVDATGWSKSKVSMLLSEMEDDGDITKLRVGRENIISLSGNEPDAAGSPFDSS
jgi:hypothetical protein